ncbi:MAG: TrkA family potassium uptake protein [Ruminococcaceae bacterium]|nr:TrkA family potassium uptake protein [Oscillospiraceae bacterium]
MKSFLIIGMGSFGHHLCRKLCEQKCEIMIVDERAEALEDMLPYVTSAKIGDCTNVDVLKSFGIDHFDACFVCVASKFQDSLEITSLLKELGAKKVFSKAEEDLQAKFLLRNGADEVIYPERDSAIKIALRESYDNIFDCIELTKDYAIYEIQPLKKWLGKSIKELNFRSRYNLNILAIKKGDTMLPLPTPDYTFKEDEHTLVFGKTEDIYKIIK